MKVVVTGASGFIGKPIVNKLLMMGCEVLAIGREITAQQKLDSLDWQPTTSLKEGIQQTKQWIDSQ